ncbi:MAG: DEAD/DEAH box helicase [Deltaproteobacteria bacterium]|nr:DEAD/DEAH box helicase [Deltaproteobacteria bacterium]
MEQFSDLGLSPNMLEGLAQKGFEQPTPIQSKIIPFLMNQDRDVVAQAATGTGKTAAFGIPIIEQLDAPCGQVKALVLAPTRELAMQVAGEIDSLKGNRKLKVTAVYGGQAMGPQLKALKRGVDIVVGTPGRLLDHLRRGSLRLEDLSFLVLDEADEMLDMGFIEDIEAILAHTPADRRTMLFSATIPRQVLTIARRYMVDYETIIVERKQKAEDLTDQIYFDVREKDKFEVLCRIIDMEPGFYGLVFCRTRVDTADLASQLVDRGYEADGIHGEINQLQREKIMNNFRKKSITILVATDVAARGIDVSNLSHVINYAMPQDSDAYLHRIGRTGRAGKKGIAITFVTPREKRVLDMIRRTAGRGMHRGHVPDVDQVIAAKRVRVKEEIQKLINENNSGPYADLAAELLDTNDAQSILAACLRYALDDELDTDKYAKISTNAPVDIKKNTRLFVARGRKHGVTPQNLVKFIRAHTGVKPKYVNNIEIFDNFTFINVPMAEATLIQKKFSQKRGRPLISKAQPEQARRAAG